MATDDSAAAEPAPGGQIPPEVIELRDGRRVLVRALRPGDSAALASAFLRLSPESQRLRFGSPPRFLGQAALHHLLDSVDGVNHVAFGAFTEAAPALLVGVGRILRYPDDPDTLDVAMTIADDYQGVGLGRALAGLLAVHRPRPATRIMTEIAHINRSAISLLGAFGEPTFRSADGDVVIELND